MENVELTAAVRSGPETGRRETPSFSPGTNGNGEPAVDGSDGSESGAEQSSATEPGPKKGRGKKKAAPVLPEDIKLSDEMDIPLEDLVGGEDRPNDKNPESIQDLARSMKRVQMNACITRWDESLKKDRIIAGRRRLLAAKIAGLRTLRCRRYEGPDDAMEHVLAAIENAQREEEPPWSLAWKLRKAEDAGLPRIVLEELYGKSKGSISEMIYSTKMPPE